MDEEFLKKLKKAFLSGFKIPLIIIGIVIIVILILAILQWEDQNLATSSIKPSTELITNTTLISDLNHDSSERTIGSSEIDAIAEGILSVKLATNTESISDYGSSINIRLNSSTVSNRNTDSSRTSATTGSGSYYFDLTSGKNFDMERTQGSGANSSIGTINFFVDADSEYQARTVNLEETTKNRIMYVLSHENYAPYSVTLMVAQAMRDMVNYGLYNARGGSDTWQNVCDNAEKVDDLYLAVIRNNCILYTIPGPYSTENLSDSSIESFLVQMERDNPEGYKNVSDAYNYIFTEGKSAVQHMVNAWMQRTC